MGQRDAQEPRQVPKELPKENRRVRYPAAPACIEYAALILGVCLPAATVIAQTAPAAPHIARSTGFAKDWSYDVISVKPNSSGTDRVLIGLRDSTYVGENVRIINLLSQAYGIKQDLIFGMPSRIDGARFDVQAKMSIQDAEAFSKLSPEDKSAATKVLLRNMLEDRFQLRAHTNTRQLPIYDLVIAKGGAKIKAATEDNTAPNLVKGPDGKALRGLIGFRDGMLADQGIEISGLAAQLTNLVHRMVIDKTGLKGRFDLSLNYAPDRDGPPNEDNGTSQDDAPSIFTALEEQLGLKLQPDKGPVETLVIDQVHQPTEN